MNYGDGVCCYSTQVQARENVGRGTGGGGRRMRRRPAASGGASSSSASNVQGLYFTPFSVSLYDKVSYFI